MIAETPLARPMTAWGKPMSARMTSAGGWGWTIRRGRYGYSPRHPETGPIPRPALEIWRRFSGWPGDPDSMLLNFHGEGARMGMHHDADEATSPRRRGSPIMASTGRASARGARRFRRADGST